MLFFLAVAMIIIAGCSKSETDNDPGKQPEDSISFTLSSTIVSPMPIPPGYTIEYHYVGVSMKKTGKNYFDIVFKIPASGGTRVFKGDTARLWLGQDMEVAPYFQVNKPYHPTFDTWALPSNCISAKIAKTNVYSFTVGFIE